MANETRRKQSPKTKPAPNLTSREMTMFQKDIQRVFRKYGFETGFFVCADVNPATLAGRVLYIGCTNPLANELTPIKNTVQDFLMEITGNLSKDHVHKNE